MERSSATKDIEDEFDDILKDLDNYDGALKKKAEKDRISIALMCEHNLDKDPYSEGLKKSVIVASMSIRDDVTKVTEAKKKTIIIASKESEVKSAIEVVKKSRTLTKEIIERKPEMTMAMLEKLKELDGKMDKYSAELADLDDLKKSVKKKVLDSKAASKKVVLDSMTLFKTTEAKIRTKIMKTLTSALLKEEKDACKTDICFLVDATGSMHPHIKNACDTILKTVEEIKSEIQFAELRIAVVAYRDYDCAGRTGSSGMFEIKNFTQDALDVKNFLSTLSACGGGDGPEDVNGGFQKVYGLDWTNKTKVLIHFADAPCHGYSMNGESSGDSYGHGHPEDKPWEALISDLKKKAIHYMFMKIGEYPRAMFNKFEQIYKSSTVGQDADLIFNMKELEDNADLFKKLVVTHIKDSITSTKHSTYAAIRRSTKYKEKALSKIFESVLDEDEDDKMRTMARIPFKLNTHIVDVKPDWKNGSFFDVNIEGKTTYAFGVKTLKDVMNNKFDFSSENVKLAVKTTPFAEGSFSLAYHCLAKPSCSTVPFNTVLKQTIKPSDKQFYYGTMKKNTVAIFLAKAYNEALLKAGYDQNHQVYFTRVLVATINSKCYLLEAFINGGFEKYTNNFDYVNESVPFMTAFSHHSYQHSGEKYMVTDLQGYNNLLTDPVIHSQDVQFLEQGDIGLKGMMAFFRHHECNDVCRRLGLNPHEAQKDKTGPALKTKVVFDISKGYKKCNYYFCNNDAGKEKVCRVCKKEVDLTKNF